MILKGYPRISESFISSEILLLESLGIPMEIYSLRQPRETIVHEHVRKIRAGVTYIPEYILPGLRTILNSNKRLFQRLGPRYLRCFAGAVTRALSRRKSATIRHFLQAGHLVQTRLSAPGVTHLHAHFCHTPASVAFFASELTGIPFSFTAHAKDIYTSEPGQLIRKIEKARFVVTCTRYNADFMTNLAGLGANGRRATPIHTIYHGIDPKYFEFRLPAEPQPPYRLISVGRLVPKKGYDDLLKALAILEQTGFPFHLTHIGDGESAREIKRLAAELGLAGRTSFLGTLSHDMVRSYYRKSHLFVLACKIAKNGDRDGIPNVLAEAMACGLPVLATNVSAVPELITDGETGLLVPSQDPSAMARAISRALLEPGAAVKRAEKARQRVEREFDSEKCVLKLYELFRQALGGNDSGRPFESSRTSAQQTGN